MTYGLNAICEDSPFWNSSAYDNRSWPWVSRCFQETALVWGPAVWLWMCLPILLVFLHHHTPSLTIRPSPLHTSKLVLCGALVVLTLVDLGLAIHSHVTGGSVLVAEYIGAGLQVACYVLVAVMTHLCRLHGLPAPCIPFIYWFLSLISACVPAYTQVITQMYLKDLPRFVVLYVTLATLLAQFLANCFAEASSPKSTTHLTKQPCQLRSASFPSKLGFQWMNSLVLTGYRKPLTEQDVPDLPPMFKTMYLVPPFMRAWQSALQVMRNRWKEEKLAQPKTVTYEKPAKSQKNGVADGEITEMTPLGAEEPQVSVGFQQPGAEAAKKRTLPSFILVLGKVFVMPILFSNALRVLSELMPFLNPLLIKLLIRFIETPREERQMWEGYMLVIALFAASMGHSIFINLAFFSSHNVGMNVRSAIISAVYRKSLTMNYESRKQFTVGAMVNLMAVDSGRLQEVVLILFLLWSAPMSICLSLYFLYQTIGIAFVAGVAVLVLLIPINLYISILLRRAQAEQLLVKDQRLKMMNEVLNGMKVLKLYAWEGSFEDHIMEIRQKELRLLRRAAILNSFTTVLWTIAPVLVTFASFLTYVLVSQDGILDSETAFVALSLFNILRNPVNQLPNVMAAIIEAQVSIERIKSYLSGDDLDPESVRSFTDEDKAVSVIKGTFTWDQSIPPTLHDISFDVGKGQLVAVVGPVGAGKSSLLSALLGEMDKLHGAVNIKGSTAYVAQQAWMQNVTLKENVTFSRDLNEERYRQIVEACALEPDIAMLPHGDDTEIGEKGINLSGGQKQRVSLARAVYEDADVYLMDDPLSAVDAHVGKHIFKHVLGSTGLLKDKTRVMVTHGVHWLPRVDCIIVMDQGRITEVGSYEELMDHDGPFAQFLKTYLLQSAEEHVDEVDEEDEEFRTVLSDMQVRVGSLTSTSIHSAMSASQYLRQPSLMSGQSHKESQHSLPVVSLSEDPVLEEKVVEEVEAEADKTKNLTEEEKLMIGRIEFKVVKSYLKAFSYAVAAATVLLYFLYFAAHVFNNVWLSIWTDDPRLKNARQGLPAEGISGTNASWTPYSEAGLNASLPGSMAPTVALGNASKTQDFFHLTYIYLAVFTGVSILDSILNFLFVLVIYVQSVHAAAVLHRDLLCNILRQPMAFFDTTPIGRIVNRFSRDVDTVDTNIPRIARQWLGTIFNVLTIFVVISYSFPIFLAVCIPLFLIYYFIQRFYIPTSRQLKRNETASRSPMYSLFGETIVGSSTIRAYRATPRFVEEFDRRVDCHNTYVFSSLAASRWLRFRLGVIGCIVVICASLLAVSMDNVTGGGAGLSVTHSLQVTMGLNILVQTTTRLETEIVSVERLVEYTEKPREAEWILRDSRPPEDWPQKGEIFFDNFQTRYRPGLDLVLKGITCRVTSGEKVGVVGRTGAGKSSLTLSLFRIIESAGGRILIDGLDIAKMGLHDLRSRLTILPQDPVLFSGTLRLNLDPFERHSDEELWTALEHAHLKDFVSSLPAGLLHQCEEGGQNLSVGQRQLLCLARSLLRQTRVLVLDEATAAVDLETDELIQKTIREEFRHCTVLTIAHRINTVMDYDKILVLSAGMIQEFGPPQELLQNLNSTFRGMAHDAGLIS